MVIYGYIYKVDILLLNVELVYVYGLFYNNCFIEKHGTAKHKEHDIVLS